MPSQDELNLLVDSLIIDNNTNQVTPAKVRAVLKSIISSITPGAVQSITAEDPLVLDGFTGLLSLNKIPFGTFRVFAKGFKPGTDATSGYVNTTNEEVRGDFCFGTDTEGYLYITRWFQGSDINNPANHKILIRLRQPLPGEPGYEPE